MENEKSAKYLASAIMNQNSFNEVVRFIFENTEIERLNGRADVRNIASNKVLQKCGFTY